MKTFRPAIDAHHDALTRRIAIGDREILVFDGLVDRGTIRRLYKFTRGLRYSWNAMDSPEQKHSVRWKFPLAEAARSLPFFADVEAFVQGLCVDPSQDLRRTYVNFNLFGEVHYGHDDAAPKAYGVTALFCVNPVWETAWQGETFFFEDGEPSYVVLPKPGRLIVFDAELVHRGSSPARDCFEPRINIAFKFERRQPDVVPRRGSKRNRGEKAAAPAPRTVRGRPPKPPLSVK